MLGRARAVHTTTVFSINGLFKILHQVINWSSWWRMPPVEVVTGDRTAISTMQPPPGTDEDSNVLGSSKANDDTSALYGIRGSDFLPIRTWLTTHCLQKHILQWLPHRPGFHPLFPW